MTLLNTIGRYLSAGLAATIVYSAAPAEAVRVKQGYIVELGEPVHERKKKEAAAPTVEETHESEPDTPPARTAEKRAERRGRAIHYNGKDYLDLNGDGKLSAQEVINHWYRECDQNPICADAAVRVSGWNLRDLFADRGRIVYDPGAAGKEKTKTSDWKVARDVPKDPFVEIPSSPESRMGELEENVQRLLESAADLSRGVSLRQQRYDELANDPRLHSFRSVLRDAYLGLEGQKKDMESLCASAAKVPGIVNKEFAELVRKKQILVANYDAAFDDASLTPEQKKEKITYYDSRMAEEDREYEQKVAQISRTIDNCRKSQADYDRAERELRERMAANLTRTDYDRMIGLDARAQLLYHGAAAASLGGSVCVITKYFGDFCAGADALAGGESASSRAIHETQEPAVVSTGIQRRTSTEGREETAREYMAATHARWLSSSAPLGRKFNASLGVELDLLLGRERTTLERTRTSQRYDALRNPIGEVNVVEGADTSQRAVHSLVPSLRLDICHESTSICGEIGLGMDIAGQEPFGSAGVLYRWK